jgi:spore maturation protein A
MLVIINTASIQLIPATVAAVRAAAGAAKPFDILPAVWVASISAVAVGIIMGKLLKRLWRN